MHMHKEIDWWDSPLKQIIIPSLEQGIYSYQEQFKYKTVLK